MKTTTTEEPDAPIPSFRAGRSQGKRTSVKIVTFEAALGAKEGVIRGKLPPDCNPQRRHVRREEHFCGAELALREQKCIPYGFAAREP